MAVLPVVAIAADQPLQSGSDSLGAAVASLYRYGLSIVGLAVFVMFLYAGLLKMFSETFISKWVPSGWEKNSTVVIQDAVIGLILLFASYLILNTINPDLVTPQKASPTSTTTSTSSSAGTVGLPTSSSVPTPVPTFQGGGGSFGGGGASGTF